MSLSFRNAYLDGFGGPHRIGGIRVRHRLSRVQKSAHLGRAGLCSPFASLQHPYPNAHVGSSTLSGGAKCPFSRVAGSLGLAKERVVDKPKPTTSDVVTPGPPAFSVQSFMDVGLILTSGIHEAMLTFHSKYGPVCRFAPISSTGGFWDQQACRKPG